MTDISRREALLRMGFGALSLSLPASLLGCADMRTSGGLQLGGPVITDFDRLSPVDRYRGASSAFSGDNPDRAQKLLLDKAAAMKDKKLKGTETCQVVVVGGGISGLISAYLLRDLHPILLDKSERMGGNSRAEAWEGVEYSLGPASFANPAKGSPLHSLFESTGVLSLCRKRSGTDPVLLNQKVYSEFWAGQTDPAAARQIKQLREFFMSPGKVPAIPMEAAGDIPLLAELDRVDFLAYLVTKLGVPLHHHVHTMLELYSWATFGASMNELSAALGMNFFSAEFGEILVPPAGNASVAERFLKLFLGVVPRRNVKSSAVVLDVMPDGEFVDVTYLDHLGDLRLIRAKTVVMACQKFVASKLIDGLEADRGPALAQLEYRAYVVGNACLKRPPTRDLHKLQLLGNGEMPLGEARRNQHNHGSTNCTFANFGQLRKENTVLTLSHPLPFREGLSEMTTPGSFDTYSALLRRELTEKILPPLGYQGSDIAELRLARWGRPIPFAKPGFYWSEAPKHLSRPFADRIFFVNQDNWAAPAIETCALEALKWTAKVREVLG